MLRRAARGGYQTNRGWVPGQQRVGTGPGYQIADEIAPVIHSGRTVIEATIKSDKKVRCNSSIGCSDVI